MTADNIRALIAALRANVGEAARGTPPTMAAKIRAGESDDDRLALMVQAADALSALTVPDGDTREQLIEVIAPSAYQAYRHDRIADAILAAFPVLGAAAPEPEWEYGVSVNGEEPYAAYPRVETAREFQKTYWRTPGATTVEILQRTPAREAGPWEPLPAGGETDG